MPCLGLQAPDERLIECRAIERGFEYQIARNLISPFRGTQMIVTPVPDDAVEVENDSLIHAFGGPLFEKSPNLILFPANLANNAPVTSAGTGLYYGK
jgi:hypothetical protein